ncbi:MAG: 4-hydroxy-tetrahydrodipicolinate reductase [Nitrospirae bacterium]|nr:4-hydroxy-tetrahydrodipicolinate reductase [Nitrospirota bacterium]
MTGGRRKVALVGAGGRMGQEIAEILHSDPVLSLGAAIESEESRLIGLPVTSAPDLVYDADLARGAMHCDVGIDFSSPEGLRRSVEGFVAAKKPLVIGTTGLTQEDRDFVREMGSHIPILWSPNMSLGVNLLAILAGQAARALGEFDAEILEIHHRHKKDAPSGTALFLGEAVASARNGALSQSGVFVRHGLTGEREPGSIGVMALRGGDVPGDHTVFFLGSGERLELTHRAESREVFARGAVRAAAFLLGRPTGFYTMADVLLSGEAEDR